MPAKRRVLFLCTGNSARSQMAEAWLRYLAGDYFEAHSAGTVPRGSVHSLAIQVMAEAGIDISAQRPKSFELFIDVPWDFIITVCDRAREQCPTFPGDFERIHWSFDDPDAATGNEVEQRTIFRCVRDEILQRLRLFVAVQTR